MRKIGLIIIVTALLWSSPVWGKVYIDINSPAFQQFPVAIPDFKNLDERDDSEKLSIQFSDSLAETLKMTGFFRIIDKNAFIENKDEAGITADTIDFHDWSVIGAEFLIKGGFQFSNENLSVEFRLFGVIEGDLIVSKKYWGTVDEMKIMIQKFTGEILLALTGERSVFGTKIAFTGKMGKTSEIYAINFDGSDLVKITNNKSLTVLPHWSNNGRQLAYTSYRRENPDLYVMDLSSGKVKRISRFKGLNLSGPWSPDGSKILLTLSKDGNEEIYILDLETEKLTRLTNDPAIDVSPTWSPDGSKIAFVSNRSGSPQIFVMDVDGSKVRRLTYEGRYNTSPSWSPKGSVIVYEGVTNGSFQLFSIADDGSNFVQLTFENGGCEYPTWSPDGRYVAFSSKEKGKIRICIINSNGLNLRVLHEEPGMEAIYPAWSPRLQLY